MVTFALTAGSLPPGLSMPAQGTSGTVLTGNPTKAGTFNFTVKATDGGLTSTLAYQITVTVRGPPDQLLCAAANGTATQQGIEPTYSFTVQGTGDQGQPCIRPTRSRWTRTCR